LTTTINRIYGVWIAVSLSLFVYSCSGQKKYTRDEYIDTFLKYLKENNAQEIDQMMYNFDHTDDVRWRQAVNKASLWINKYGLPPKDKWRVQHGGLGELFVTIPFFSKENSVDSLTSTKLILSFPSEKFSIKLMDFEAIDTVNDYRGKVMGPQRIGN